MHECLLCRRDMKDSNDIFGNGCIKNIYSFFMFFKIVKHLKNKEKTNFCHILSNDFS